MRALDAPKRAGKVFLPAARSPAMSWASLAISRPWRRAGCQLPYAPSSTTRSGATASGEVEWRFKTPSHNGDHTNESATMPLPTSGMDFQRALYIQSRKATAAREGGAPSGSQLNRQVHGEEEGDEVGDRMGQDQHASFHRAVHDGPVWAVDPVLHHIEVGVDPIACSHEQDNDQQAFEEQTGREAECPSGAQRAIQPKRSSSHGGAA